MDSDTKTLLILDLGNAGLCYLILLCHSSYYKAELLLEHSYHRHLVSQSV